MSRLARLVVVPRIKREMFPPHAEKKCSHHDCSLQIRIARRVMRLFLCHDAADRQRSAHDVPTDHPMFPPRRGRCSRLYRKCSHQKSPPNQHVPTVPTVPADFTPLYKPICEEKCRRKRSEMFLRHRPHKTYIGIIGGNMREQWEHLYIILFVLLDRC